MRLSRAAALFGCIAWGIRYSGWVTETTEQYPADEFENPEDLGPVGAHRKPRSRWRPVVPFLLVLVLAPLLAWAVTALMQRNQDAPEPQSAPESAQSAVVEPAQSAPVVPEEPQSEPEPAPEPEPEPEPEPQVDRAAGVLILNASGRGGYAGQMQGTLSGDGFTAVSVGNGQGAAAENTVFYSSEDQVATANQVAAVLGITAVVNDPAATPDAPITVLLVN